MAFIVVMGVAFVVVGGVAFVVLGWCSHPATHPNACRINTDTEKTPKSKKKSGFFCKRNFFLVKQTTLP